MATTNKKTKLKEPVRIRTKKLADGSESYYLDIYTDGKRSYEFLKLYRLPEINARVKEQNKATLAAVETIKSQRIIELTHNKAGLKNTSARSKILLTDWMQTFYDDQKRRGVRGVKLLGTVSRLITTYIGKNKVRMGDIDKEFCMNAAVRADIIPENPFMSLTPTERIKVPESKREFLTVDEIKTLIATECPREDVKRAYLFACYCGLRLSDVYALKWKDLSQDGEQWRASVVMQKTTTPIFLPLSGQAVKWLPERGEAKDDENVFEGLIAEPNINKVLAKWTKAAGITKKITYHTSRHTFATMMLTLGADLYTTSKLLGHSNVKTTQIYAKIVDSKKVEAVNLVDSIFD